MVAFAQLEAASFADVEYDRTSDELVVTLAYRGTHADHQFFVEWGRCQESETKGRYEVAARVHDQQWNDRAEEPFEKTVRFALSKLTCRPALVTLYTEPNFRSTVFVPARPSEGT